MDVNQMQLFSMMKTSMGYYNERQAVLSQNMANIDTPGYRAKDLKKLDFKKLVSLESHRLQMRMTSPTHMMGSKVDFHNFRSEEQDPTYETTPMKSNVVLEEQMGKVAMNKVDNEKVTGMYKKWSDFMKKAASSQ